MIRSLGGIQPRIAASAYVDESAILIGKVELGERVSVWPTVVMRGDNEWITIGADSNIQDGTIMHTDPGFPAIIGARVTVGHRAMLHGCVVEDDGLIGIGAVVLNGARIGKGAVVAAGALVPEGMQVEAGMLVMGTPAKPRRPVTPDEQERFRKGVEVYVERGQRYREGL